MSLCKIRSDTSTSAAARSFVGLIGHLILHTASKQIEQQVRSLQELTASNLRSAAAAAAEAAGTHGSQQQLSVSSLGLQLFASHTLLVPEPQDHSQLSQLVPESHFSQPSQQTKQQSETALPASVLSVHVDGIETDDAGRQSKPWSGKPSLEAESTFEYPANISQQQQQQIQYGQGVAQNNSTQAQSSGQQLEQQQSHRMGLPGTQADAAGGDDGVDSANTEQDEAAKEAYRQWSASFEASQVSTRRVKARSVKLHGWGRKRAK